ncbi:MAG: FRG domain-containing protein [Pseudomonadota bacterium]
MDRKISTVSDALKIVNELHNQRPAPSGVLYRGVGSYKYNLEPSLSRYLAPSKPLRNMRGDSFKEERIKWKEVFSKTEKGLIEDFKKLAWQMLSYKPKNDWEWIAVAQHHGVPTRLLDWTTNLLIGLWFATDSSGVHANIDGGLWVYTPFGSRDGDTEDIGDTEWLLDQMTSDPTHEQYIGPTEVNRTRIYVPNNLDPRIQMQSGVFTAHQLMPNDGFFDLVPLNKNGRERLKVSRIRVPKRAKAQIRTQLARDFGLDLTKVFPDVDGVALSLKAAWEPTVKKIKKK